MDEEEYHCSARPNMPSTVFDTNNISSHPGDKYFRIEFDYKKIWVQTDTNHQSLENIERYTLRKVSADKLMEETTIPSWLSHIKFPKEYFALMVEEILRCARDMVNGTTYNNLKFLCIRVDFSLTIPLEDDSCDEGDYGDEENLCLEEDKEEIEVGEEDNGLALPITSAIESETYEELDYEVYFEDDYRGYQWNNGLDEFEDEEEMEVEEVDNRFVPAAKSFIEGLKMVEVEEVEKCAICFEDFNVGVRIPCSHMFHMTCICDWLVIGNSCPLCRFQLPT